MKSAIRGKINFGYIHEFISHTCSKSPQERERERVREREKPFDFNLVLHADEREVVLERHRFKERRRMAQKLEQQLKEVGSKLETPPSTKDALVKLLKVFYLHFSFFFFST